MIRLNFNFGFYPPELLAKRVSSENICAASLDKAPTTRSWTRNVSTLYSSVYK